jgi:hypothetical protein
MNEEITNNNEPNNTPPELTPQEIKRQIKIFRNMIRGNRGKHSKRGQNNGAFGKSKHK